ncbi:MAG TPA: hypothetical protein VH234_02445 [Candidatus Saccharimonadales bacterium]|nr:hypothetical protein [Candidatus Saccharimonadales bacterium]
MKTAPISARRRRLIKYGLITILVIVVLVILGLIIHTKVLPNRSQKLNNIVSTLEDGKHHCSDGLKQIGSLGPQLAGSSKYSTDVREQALNYIISCTFETGNTKQALVYAYQLQKLYTQDGSKSAKQQQNLTQLIKYMESYGK